MKRAALPFIWMFLLGISIPGILAANFFEDTTTNFNNWTNTGSEIAENAFYNNAAGDLYNTSIFSRTNGTFQWRVKHNATGHSSYIGLTSGGGGTNRYQAGLIGTGANFRMFLYDYGTAAYAFDNTNIGAVDTAWHTIAFYRNTTNLAEWVGVWDGAIIGRGSQGTAAWDTFGDLEDGGDAIYSQYLRANFTFCDDALSCSPSAAAVSITDSSYNLSSAFNAANETVWRSDKNNTAWVNDTTPTLQFSTSGGTNCTISPYNLNYSTLIAANGSVYECSTNNVNQNVTAHTCTLPAAFAYPNDFLYVACVNSAGSETVTSTSGQLNISMINSPPQLRINSPSSPFTSTGAAFSVSFNYSDFNGEAGNVSLMVSSDNGTTWREDRRAQFSDGQNSNSLTSLTYQNSSALWWILNATNAVPEADFLNFNTSVSNVTIYTVRPVFPSSFYLRSPPIFDFRAGFQNVSLRYRMAWNYTGNETEGRFPFNITLPPNSSNISAYAGGNLSTPPNLNESILSFDSFNLTTACNQSVYSVEFEAPVLEVSDNRTACTSDNFGGNCSFIFNLNNSLGEQLYNVSIFINASQLPEWGKRTSLDVSWTNLTSQSEQMAVGDVYCVSGGGGGFGVSEEGTGSSSYNSTNQTAQDAAFSGALTDENTTINPRFEVRDYGLNITNIRIGSVFGLALTYSYSEGGSGGGGGSEASSASGSGPTYEVIGNLTASPKKIDWPVIGIPEPYGKDEVYFWVDTSIEPDYCYVESGQNSLQCEVVDKRSRITYTLPKDLWSQRISDRVIIEAASGVVKVPIVFRYVHVYLITAILFIIGALVLIVTLISVLWNKRGVNT